jgi:hypothetical protein
VWFINGDDTATRTGGTGDSLAGGGFPVCAETNSDTFPLSTLNGFENKDVNNKGDHDAGDLNGAGLTFDLKSGAVRAADRGLGGQRHVLAHERRAGHLHAGRTGRDRMDANPSRTWQRGRPTVVVVQPGGDHRRLRLTRCPPSRHDRDH